MPTEFIVAITLLSMAVVLLTYKVIYINKNNTELAKELLKLRDGTNESYIKFLITSRDGAFEYIEEVQKALKAFVDEVEPQLNYFNTYGRAVPSHNDIALDLITKALGELKTVLPEDNKEK